MKATKFIVLALLLLLFSVNLYSQEWVLAGNVTQPGLTPSVSVGSPNVIWIAGGTGTPKIFRSTNGGVNWEVVSTTGITQELTCVAGFDGQMAIVGEGIVNGNARLFKTANGGANWVVVAQTGNNRGFFNGLAFTKDNGNLYGIAVAERVYRTSNSGENWIELNSGASGVSNAQNSLIIIDDNFYGFGLNNGAARLRLTTDNSANWTTQQLNITGSYTSAVAFNTNKLLGIAATSTSMPMIARTTDGGTTWNSINIGSGLTGTVYVNWIPQTSVIYIMGENGGMKRSIDSGLTWITMPTDSVTNLKHFDFVLNNNIVYGYAVSSNGAVIKLVDTLSTLTGISSNNDVPKQFSLGQNYPNPFNPTTGIEFSVAKESFVNLTIYDALGREVSLVVNENKKQGKYNVSFDGANLNSGVYFYILKAGDFSQTRKMILLK
ncbi:MAG TPA: T9SS type A sorting domain-containing protein [Ignavibacteria bacterium]